MNGLPKPILLLLTLLLVSGGCAMYQSIIKSSFPYTTTLTVSGTAQPGSEHSAINMANSFDQNFNFTKRSDADRITLVRVISAKLTSVDPTDYNIGDLSAVKIYLSREDGTDEMLVAQRDSINVNAGNTIPLNTDNSKMLDQLVREKSIRVRMFYKTRQTINRDANVQVVLGLSAYPRPVDNN
jgi:hypothetical protein